MDLFLVGGSLRGDLRGRVLLEYSSGVHFQGYGLVGGRAGAH